MISFKNSNIYLNNKKVIKSSLTIKGDKFFSTKPEKNAITLNSKYIIVPGFIEEHIHGVSNADTMHKDKNALHIIASNLVKDGTTSFCPTTMTMSKKDIKDALKNIKNKKYINGEAKILGVHLEGPFISKIYKGAQDEKYVIKPNINDMKDFLTSSGNNIKMITIAPEEADNAFIKYLVKNNIVVSMGHSNAKAIDAERAIKAGATCTTHTYNAMSKLHHRDIGLVGEALLHKEIYSELILDLQHVSKEAAQLLLKNKGKEHLILITDSMEARNMPDGIYKLGTYPVYKKGLTAKLKDGTLAGSILKMNDALKNAKKIFNLKFEEIINLASKNVADNLRLKKVGCIQPGYYADFVIIDKDFNVYQTYVNGKLAYSKKGFKL